MVVEEVVDGVDVVAVRTVATAVWLLELANPVSVKDPVVVTVLVVPAAVWLLGWSWVPVAVWLLDWLGGEEISVAGGLWLS